MEWVDTTIAGYLARYYGHDNIFLINSDGQVRRSWRQGQVSTASDFTPLLPYVKHALNSVFLRPKKAFRERNSSAEKGNTWAEGNLNNPNAKWEGHVIVYRGEPALMSLASIVPDKQFELAKKRPNWIISIQRLDKRFLRQMSGLLQLKQLRLVRSPDLRSEDASAQIVADDGTPAGYLVWKPSQPGRILLDELLPSIVAGMLFTIMVSFFLMRRISKTSFQLAESEARASHMALHDHLSGLPNRYQLQQLLETMIEKSLDCRRQVLVAFVDLDRFKEINDTLGHQAGDDLVKLVAKRLRASLTSRDVVARLSGDEFVVARIALEGPEAAKHFAADIFSAFTQVFPLVGKNVVVSASCGIASAPHHGKTVSEILRNADMALYAAKGAQRGSWQLFTAELDATLQLRRNTEIDLRSAIERDELSVVYQPIINSSANKIVAVEALVRWLHPERGLIEPSFFIPIAEQAGFISALGEWVFERVCRDSAQWQNVEISVNLSPIQLRSPNLIPSLERTLAQHGLRPDRFCFEITEGILMDDSELLRAQLQQLRQMGFSLSLDDFGTGYSSLSYLRRYEFDKIKIDRAFVRNLHKDLDSLSIIRAVVSLGEALRMKIVAEGVETQLQHDLVRAAGCIEMQGYLFFKPMEAKALETVLAKPLPKPSEFLRAA